MNNILIDGSAAAGIHAETATSFSITDVAVRDTMADGIHMTGGSTGGTVVRPRVCVAGDDGVAVVSYGDQPLSGSITVDAPMVRDQYASAAGQRIEDVEVSGLEITDTHPQAPWVVGLNGNGAAMANIRMDRIEISGTRPTRILRSLAGLPVISGWTLDGAPYP